MGLLEPNKKFRWGRKGLKNARTLKLKIVSKTRNRKMVRRIFFFTKFIVYKKPSGNMEGL